LGANRQSRALKQNRLFAVIVLITIFFGSAMEKHSVFFTEANLLPDNHIVNKEYNAFLDMFEEGNLIVVG
jgi:hypothetical protein